ncbi:MAG TPA: hypothetical protein VKU82_16295, partial [Planctomycetaceae bacterium]|nr:hypothetical protein [Planctomycetaceae bacterium]
MPKSPLAAGLLLLAAFLFASHADAEPLSRRAPAWLDKTQTYCMVPVLPEMAAKLHVSVNGVWAGIGGTHPVLTHREI